MASNTNRYWCGFGPKLGTCARPNCPGTIPMGVLCHQKYNLGLKPKCRICDREYKIPPGAERPYLTKGGVLKGQGKGKGKGKGDTGEGDGKDKRIAALEKALKAKGGELPKEEPTEQEQEELKDFKELQDKCTKAGCINPALDKKIQEREAAEKAKVLALPAIEGKLKVARSKLNNLNVKYKNLQNQFKLCAEAGEAALEVLDDLQAQKVTALEQQGYTPKQEPKEEEKQTPPPDNLHEQQKQAWFKAVQDHNECHSAFAKAAS